MRIIGNLIKAPKEVVSVGKWQWGKLGGKDFPLSRSPIKLGPNWRWRVERCTAGGRALRLLVFFRADREQFRAWLAEETPAGLVMLARLEDDACHPGLHLHVQCREDVGRPVGRIVHPDLRSFPRPGGPYRRRGEFTEMTAWALVQKFFNVGLQTSDGLL